MAAKKSTHTTVHAIQFYDKGLKRTVELAPNIEFNPANLDADIDIARLEKRGAVKKITAASRQADEGSPGTNTAKTGANVNTTDTDNEDNPLAVALDGTVDEVNAGLDQYDEDDLQELRKLEVAGKNRKGVLDEIDAYLAGDSE